MSQRHATFSKPLISRHITTRHQLKYEHTTPSLVYCESSNGQNVAGRERKRRGKKALVMKLKGGRQRLEELMVDEITTIMIDDEQACKKKKLNLKSQQTEYTKN